MFVVAQVASDGGRGVVHGEGADLEGRGTDSPERRAARLALAQEEMAAASFFDKVLINDQVDGVVASLIEFASA